MESNNLLFFNNFTLALFDKLYKSFPVPCDIDITQFALDLLPDDIELKSGLDKLKVARASLNFLSQEGFIVCGGVSNNNVHNAIRLTMKGLTSLGYVPDSLEPSESLISKISDISQAGIKEAGIETTKSIIQQLFAVALASSSVLIT